MQSLRWTRLAVSPIGVSSLTNNGWLRSEGPKFAATSLGIGGVRHKITKPNFTGGPRYPVEGENVIKYPGFNYYPRHANHVDPPYEPTKLFAVRRIQTLKRRPYWERRVVEGEFGLGSRRTVAIVKNTPRNNAQLFTVKHLIEITPITFPNGIPSDPKNGFLKENGEFIVYDKLAPTGAESMEQVQEDVAAVRRRDVDGATLKKRLNLQWQSRW